jgi:hypothetical protein
MYQLIGGIALAVLLMFGAYRAGTKVGDGTAYQSGYSVGMAEGDKIGYQRGALDANNLNSKAMLALVAEARAESERLQREAIERIQTKERERLAAQEADRAAFAANEANLRRVVAGLLAKLRVAETAARDKIRDANDSGAVPADPATAVRAEGALFTEWLFSERGGRRIIELAGRSEEVNGRLNYCKDLWPVAESGPIDGGVPMVK